MSFFGVKIGSGETYPVMVDKGTLFVLRQVILGEETKDTVTIHAIVDGKRYPLATLHPEWAPVFMFNVRFDRSFQIQHTSINGSVYLFGFKEDNPLPIQRAKRWKALERMLNGGDGFGQEEEEEENERGVYVEEEEEKGQQYGMLWNRLFQKLLLPTVVGIVSYYVGKHRSTKLTL